MLLNSGEVPGLQWVSQEDKIFSIPWKHASGRTWKGQDADLFERYAIHTGKHTIGGQADHKRWKANFRCALNSLHDVEELQDRSMKTGEFAYKLYRFLEGDEKKSIKKGKLSDRRLSDSSGGDIGDMSEDQNVGDGSNAAKQEVDEDQKATDLCLPHPPEIKDHNYSFVKSVPRVSVNECVRVIDADAVRKLLNKDMKKKPDGDEDANEEGGEEEECMNPEIEDSELSPLSITHSSAVLSTRNSVDDTIEAVVEGSRSFGEANFGMDRPIKSELIIDDRSAQFVSNVMEVDTSPEMIIQSETRARIASAHSLAALSGIPISNDLAEEESNLAASILLDLSRMKRRSLQPRQASFGNERMEEETPPSEQANSKPGKGTWDSNNDNRQSVATEMSSAGEPSEEPTNTVVPLDLRIKTEPMDEAYETYNSDLSGAIYRSRHENSDSDDEEETCLELTPPPAHSYSTRIWSTSDDSLPQPLDLSVKVHNLMLVDYQDSSPQTSVCRPLYGSNEKSQMNFSCEEQNDPSEPLDLQVKKAHRDMRTPPSNEANTQVCHGTPCPSEQTMLPLDLSIVKSEPMDESYEQCCTTEATPLNYSRVGTSEIRAIGPVPDLIQVPSSDQVIGEEQSLKQEESSDGFIDLTKKSKKEELKVPVPIALFINQVEKEPGSSAQAVTSLSGETASGVVNGEQPKLSDVASSSPTIKSLLQRKTPVKRPLSPTCVLCHMMFANHHQLSAHMLEKHTDATDLNLAKRKLFQCTVCAKVFKEGSRLERHMKTHKGKGIARCSGCKQVFDNKDKFAEHSLLCSPAGLRCDNCGEIFSDRPSYAEHVKTHQSDVLFLVKPYQCAICNSTFENCNLLQEHMEQHKSGQITVPCCRCRQHFTSWRVDSGGWSSICEECEVKWPKDKTNTSLLRQNLSGMSVLLQAVERTVKGSETN
ncbi:uncharacterized protein LOC135464439 [Liolophura sinensis]|uniref:uncharacterized protein LOC135464439 n=1 Tax=Liolophura sinensis TaxID=3198878 RepID=UPI0031594989